MKKLLLILVCFLTYQANAQEEISDSNTEEKLLQTTDQLIFLDFYATWCGPCKKMDPIIKELTKKYEGKVLFYKMDVDKNDMDDAMNVSVVPTYFFIKDGKSVQSIEGAMSKEEMVSLIEKHMNASTVTTTTSGSFGDQNHESSNEFESSNTDKFWNDSSKLNSVAWHAYKKHKDIDDLLNAIKIVKRSIDLEENYYNVDTYAALLYKTGNYTKALKKAKKAIDIAKENGESYSSTTELIDKIIEKL